jgi:gamma-glutamyl hercynylcysteine S-oxide synthase
MKKKEEIVSVTVEPVHLKPIWGMQPGMYLTILYVVVFLLVVFFIGILPGILNGGKRVSFTSNVVPVSVSVDGKLIGTAPTTVFLTPGEHEVLYAFKDVVSESFSISVGHPVFFTWLFPRTQNVSYDIEFGDISTFRNYINRMLNQLPGWSSILDFSETYHYPPLLSQTATTIATIQAKQLDAQSAQVVHDSYSAAFRFITSEVILHDAQEALTILKDSGTLNELILGSLQQELDAIGLLYSGSLEKIGLSPGSLEFTITQDSLRSITTTLPSIIGFSYTGNNLVVGEEVILEYPSIVRIGVEQTVSDFSISALEISEYLWALFMRENPYWAKENIEKLVADGMVDGNYLAGIYPSTTLVSNRPVKNISWYAANAFTQWLSLESGYRVLLPSEAQWEFAARSVAFRPYQTSLTVIADSRGPSGMLGSYWEMTRDSFIPLARYLGDAPAQLSEVSDIIVKGGSYLNDPNHVTIATVGVQSRTTCSETTGFRIVWTK